MCTDITIEKIQDTDKIPIFKYDITVKLLNNGHPFCRGLVAVVDECPLVRGCVGKCQQTHVYGEITVVLFIQSRTLDILDQQNGELTCNIGHISNIYRHVYHLDHHEVLFHN